MLRILTAAFTGFTSTAALAHAGHDHSHWLSNPIHALSIFAVVSIVAVSAVALKRKVAKQKQK